MKSILFVLCVLASFAQAAPLDLKGTVTDENGKPAPGAVVYVYECSPRKGASSLNPSSWPDCGKYASTDDAGAFTIAGLDENLVFKIAVAAEDHPTLVVNRVDPAKPMKAKLKAIDPARKEPANQLRGKVSDAKGPVIGAEVKPFGMRNGERRWWGGVEGADNFAITNAKGEFLITSKDPDVAIDLHVGSPHHASVNYALLQTGDQVHEIALTTGAIVKGKIVQQGQPVAGIVMAAMLSDRGAENWTGRVLEAITDAQGSFTLEHLAPGKQYTVFATMKSMEGKGAVPLQRVTADGDEQTSELTEAEVQPAFTVSGRLRLSDEKPVPSGTTMYLSREDAWDSQQMKVDKDGKFKFTGVPGNEAIDLSLRIKGYHLSDQNVSLDVINPSMMTGLVDGDISDLDVLMEPGDPDYNNRAQGDQQRLRATRLEGVPGTTGGAAESK